MIPCNIAVTSPGNGEMGGIMRYGYLSLALALPLPCPCLALPCPCPDPLISLERNKKNTEIFFPQ